MSTEYLRLVHRNARPSPLAALSHPDGRMVRIARIGGWLAHGWQAACAQPLLWLSVMLLCADIATFAQLAPLLSPLALLLVPYAVGILIAAQHRAQSGRTATFSEIKSIALARRDALLVVAFAMLAYWAIAYVFAIGMRDILQSIAASNDVRAFAHAPHGMTGIAPGVPALIIALAASGFAPALVVLHDASPLEAMAASLKAAALNWRIALVCVLAFVCAAALLPAMSAMLRALVATPLVTALPLLAIYGSYRDIFVERR
ncbi:hypothetical protein [Burkholderia singularis]|uniref:DUF2189 domain-containing protein n=1 Tax=Burkholderia singularis TaxID=1503053 RepID=A0A238H4K2_9BURK|nr:hypothetical protein [Burkholderia singularis]SMG00150.1 hypothetical protein BSIN_0275 [Burkholderia singularis]